jgi:hypothetical protein
VEIPFIFWVSLLADIASETAAISSPCNFAFRYATTAKTIGSSWQTLVLPETFYNG